MQNQNELSRNGFWLALTQAFTRDSASIRWANANQTQGYPDRPNTAPADPDVPCIANPSNGANR
jgi:hypothetical protein